MVFKKDFNHSIYDLAINSSFMVQCRKIVLLITSAVITAEGTKWWSFVRYVSSDA